MTWGQIFVAIADSVKISRLFYSSKKANELSIVAHVMDDTGRDPVTPEALVDLLVPNEVQISPNGKYVVYSCAPIAKVGEHTICSLWIADTGKEYSARQLTSGLYNDVQPQWCPMGKITTIAFVSDRAKHGESSAICIMHLDSGAGEAYPVTKAENKKPIEAFKWSPNGQYIAFTSPDENSQEKDSKEQENGGVKVWGEDWEYNRLRCLHVATRDVTTLSSRDSHVREFAWSENSTSIAYAMQETPEFSSAGYHGIKFERVEMAKGKTYSIVQEKFPGPVKDLVWYGDSLFFLAGVTPNSAATSSAIYEMSVREGIWSRFAFGEKNCAVGLKMRAGQLRALIQDGLEDRIISFKSTNSDDFVVDWNALSEIGSWDVLTFSEGDNQKIVIFAGHEHSYRSLSDGEHLLPMEVRSFGSVLPMITLSQHGKTLAKFDFGFPEPLQCVNAEDGTDCDGIIIRSFDKGAAGKVPPTVVLVHGGPYGRKTVAFNAVHYYWSAYLVSAGYTVLCPNYRGGSSHGEHYASQARHGMGTTDYTDIISLVKAGISKGFINEHNVAIGGWSQGGFLSYLAVTRSDFQFKATVCGAGVTDWDMMSMTSDAPWFEAELAGRAPWETGADDTEGRQGSAIWNMKDVKIKTPILILHGEEDKRIPLTQAVAFHRGCLRWGWPCEFVVYPREEHRFKERKHMIDMLKRVRRFYDLHLK